MIAPALLYRPSPRWQIWLAFGCTAAFYLLAIALARTDFQASLFPPPTDSGVDVVIDPTPDQTPPQPAEPTPTELSEFVKPDEAFPEESSTPAPIRPPVRKPVYHLIRSASAAAVPRPGRSSVKVLAIYAPRPEYPYEARRQRTTGSGSAVLLIDSLTGSVTDARMEQSTGSIVLDNSTVSMLQRWRFKSETVTKVQVPITYTLNGAYY